MRAQGPCGGGPERLRPSSLLGWQTGSSRLPGLAGGTPEAPISWSARVFAFASGQISLRPLTAFIGYVAQWPNAVGLLAVAAVRFPAGQGRVAGEFCDTVPVCWAPSKRDQPGRPATLGVEAGGARLPHLAAINGPRQAGPSGQEPFELLIFRGSSSSVHPSQAYLSIFRIKRPYQARCGAGECRPCRCGKGPLKAPAMSKAARGGPLMPDVPLLGVSRIAWLLKLESLEGC